jgi:hypothetical protein
MRERHPTPTYDQHVGPFDKIEAAEEQVKSSKEALLRRYGWKHTSSTPGCYWLWEKAMPDGRTLLVTTEIALRFAREEATDKVDPAEFSD